MSNTFNTSPSPQGGSGADVAKKKRKKFTEKNPAPLDVLRVRPPVINDFKNRPFITDGLMQGLIRLARNGTDVTTSDARKLIVDVEARSMQNSTHHVPDGFANFNGNFGRYINAGFDQASYCESFLNFPIEDFTYALFPDVYVVPKGPIYEIRCFDVAYSRHYMTDAPHDVARREGMFLFLSSIDPILFRAVIRFRNLEYMAKQLREELLAAQIGSFNKARKKELDAEIDKNKLLDLLAIFSPEKTVKGEILKVNRLDRVVVKEPIAVQTVDVQDTIVTDQIQEPTVIQTIEVQDTIVADQVHLSPVYDDDLFLLPESNLHFVCADGIVQTSFNLVCPVNDDKVVYTLQDDEVDMVCQEHRISIYDEDLFHLPEGRLHLVHVDGTVQTTFNFILPTIDNDNKVHYDFDRDKVERFDYQDLSYFPDSGRTSDFDYGPFGFIGTNCSVKDDDIGTLCDDDYHQSFQQGVKDDDIGSDPDFYCYTFDDDRIVDYDPSLKHDVRVKFDRRKFG